MLIKLEEGKRYRVTLEGFYYETKLQRGEIILRRFDFNNPPLSIEFTKQELSQAKIEEITND